MKLVRRAWKHAEPAPTELGAEPLQRRPWSRLDEIERATREGGVMGVGWPYRVTAYKFMGRDEATRDSLSVALGQSAWMAESLDAAASEDACMLWGVWRNLQHAETTAQFDCAMRALHDLAELDGCWIELLEASRAD